MILLGVLYCQKRELGSGKVLGSGLLIELLVHGILPGEEPTYADFKLFKQNLLRNDFGRT